MLTTQESSSKPNRFQSPASRSGAAGSSLIREGLVGPAGPVLIEPVRDHIALAGWAKANLDLIDAALLRHGSILFRGFGIDRPERLEEFATAISGELYRENGEHPRESLSGRIYTPVFYPSEKHLLWHNENSFNHDWPHKIWFACQTAPGSGGETPVVDSRAVYRRIDPAIRSRFQEKGIAYVRNYGTGFGLDWRTVYRTDSKEGVEDACRGGRMQFVWNNSGGLRTIAVRPAVIRHRVTGEWSWFNQAQHWHVSCLEAEVREALTSCYAEEDLPRHCYFGDGSPIEDSIMQEILAVYRELEVAFPWREGDVLMIDNVLAAHGRNAYEGPRKILVALAEMTAYREEVCI